MKRSEALQPLSRDHHQALYVALQLRRADDPVAGREAFLEFWDEHGREHFRIEEEVLLPVWGELGTPDPGSVARVAQEHLAIRVAARRLAAAEPELEALHELGDLLDGHVRFEERELFPLIEEDLDVQQLDRMADAVEEAEAGG